MSPEFIIPQSPSTAQSPATNPDLREEIPFGKDLMWLPEGLNKTTEEIYDLSSPPADPQPDLGHPARNRILARIGSHSDKYHSARILLVPDPGR